MTKRVVSIVISLIVLCIFARAENDYLLQYDISYNIVQNNMSITYNAENTDKSSIQLIAALYRGDILQAVFSKPVSDETDNTIVIELPSEDREQYCVKAMVWEDMIRLRPVGKIKRVRDIEPYLREKTVIVSANAGDIVNLYMNTENTIGDNADANHTITYNSQKLEIVDLCGFTYEKELSVGKIANIGLNIREFNSQAGTAVFNFDLKHGRNAGVNNLVKFKALSDMHDEEIIYSIE